MQVYVGDNDVNAAIRILKAGLSFTAKDASEFDEEEANATCWRRRC